MRVLALLALFALAAARETTAVTPVQKVVTLLEDLQAKVQEEGKEEAAQYDKFACFCKDTTDEKTTAISENQVAVTKYEEDLREYVEIRAAKDEAIAESNAELVENEASIKEITDVRKSERLIFVKAQEDLEGAIDQCQRAVEVLKAGRASVSMAQMVSVKKAVQAGFLIAQSLDLSVAQRKNLGLLQGAEEPEVDLTPSWATDMNPDKQAYEGKIEGSKMIDTLENLKKTFRDELNEKEKAESEAQHTYNMALQDLENEKKKIEGVIEGLKKDKAEAVQNIAQASQDLTLAQATLTDDRQYLRDLTSDCEEKAETWDQRSQTRASELAALSQAQAIIKGTVDELTQKSNAGSRHSEKAKERKAAMKERAAAAAKEKLAAAPEEATSFLQMSADTTLVYGIDSAPSRRNRAAMLLKSVAQRLHLPALSTLATQVKGGDPFAKVKALIQELIERLLEEAETEASHHGWCETEMASNKVTRDEKQASILDLNTQLEVLHAKKDVLTEEIATLKKEVAELNTALVEATALREEEKKDNTQTIEDSKEGSAAVGQAIAILSDFYKNAGAPATTLLQDPYDRRNAPEAGFDGTYHGQQAAAGGILGMLEVIQNDFDRTVKETTEAEAEAAAAYVDFERQTKVSITSKETTGEQKQEELDNVASAIGSVNEQFADNIETLDAKVEEYKKLEEACVFKGVKYDDRVARREEEIQALKEALQILEGGDFIKPSGPFEGLIEKSRLRRRA